MRKMKDSKIEWVGEIPESWEVMPIRALFNENRKINYLGKVTKSLQFKMGTIVPKTNFEAETDDYVADTILKYNIVDKGMIVLNGLNLNFDFVTKRVAMVHEHGIITSAYISFYAKDHNQLMPEYATYLFKCYDNCAAFHNMGGGVRKILNFEELKHNLFVLPSYREQHAIVDFLDRECERIDGLKADIEAQIETLEKYKRSVITEAVTHGLNPVAPMKDSGLEWIETIPQGWNVLSNKYLMQKIKYICPTYNGEDILSLTMNGVIVRDLDAGGKMPSSFDGYQKIYAGNLLMCLFDIDVTPRCIGLITCNGVTSPAYSQFAMKTGAYAPFYNYYYLMMDYTKELLHLAKNLRHSLNEEQFGNIKAPVPPLSEQQAIADYLDEKCAQIDELIAQKQSQIETLETYKKSLIFEYVTGKKEVV